MDQSLQLHGLPTSSSTRRVLTTLLEKEVKDFKLVRVDLSKQEHKTPQHLAMQVSLTYMIYLVKGLKMPDPIIYLHIHTHT